MDIQGKQQKSALAYNRMLAWRYCKEAASVLYSKVPLLFTGIEKDDLVSETYINIQKSKALDLSKHLDERSVKRLRSYIHRATRNTAINLQRKGRQYRPYEASLESLTRPVGDSLESVDVESLTQLSEAPVQQEYAELSHLLDWVQENLPETQRESLLINVLGINKPFDKSRVYRARKTMLEHLDCMYNVAHLEPMR